MTNKDEKRVGLRLSGPQLQSIRDVMELVAIPDEAAAVRYLVSKGIESLSQQIRAKRLMDKMETHYSPQQMLEFMEKNNLVLVEEE